MNTQNIEDNCNANLNLAYEYTKSLIEAKSKIIDNLNSRMGIFLGFGGVLLKFGIDMPTKLISEEYLKSAFLTLAMLSVSANAIGLLGRPTGNVVKPRKLMTDEYYNEENARVKAFIINSWVVSEESLDALISIKCKYLNSAIVLLALTLLILGCASIIEVFYKYTLH
jgi:hypothetical protein